jgi:hypothetical protein
MSTRASREGLDTMIRNLVRTVSAVLLAGFSLLSPVAAQLPEPGSALVYPEFDNRQGRASVFTLTNAGSANTRVHLVFLNATTCQEFDRSEALTANDTFTTLTSGYVAGVARGWFYAFAQHPTTGRPISRNALTGMVSVFDGVAGTNYGVPAISFRSPLPPDTVTDLDNDGSRDLDGEEYAAFADQVVIPRFIGQTATYREELILLPLTGGPDFTSQVRFLIFNDNESVFSASYNVRCWAKVPLATISSSFSHSFLASSPDDANEHVGGRETGWFLVDGGVATSTSTTLPDPAILAVLITPEGGGGPVLPFGRGAQMNGDLPPNGFGD